MADYAADVASARARNSSTAPGPQLKGHSGVNCNVEPALKTWLWGKLAGRVERKLGIGGIHIRSPLFGRVHVVAAGSSDNTREHSSWNSDFNFISAQNRTPAALSCQPQIVLAAVGWRARLAWQFG